MPLRYRKIADCVELNPVFWVIIVDKLRDLER